MISLSTKNSKIDVLWVTKIQQSQNYATMSTEADDTHYRRETRVGGRFRRQTRTPVPQHSHARAAPETLVLLSAAQLKRHRNL